MITRKFHLPGYRLKEPLGKGSQGVVFKSIQLSLNREVAIKVLSPDLAAKKKFRERFLREAKAAGQMNHINITRTEDTGEADGHYYIIMEYVDGTTVARILRENGKLPVATAANIASQVADGLAHAHSIRIVHRDIKPSNIMLNSSGTAKIMDMGVAKRLSGEGEEDLTITGEMVGTPQYMSPEQIRSSRDVGPSTDVYSLGAMLYHMVAGKAPFEGTSAGDVMLKVAANPVRFPLSAAKGLPAPLKRLIKRMLSKDPRSRPSAEEVASLLRDMLKNNFKEETTSLRRRKAIPPQDNHKHLKHAGIAAGAVLVFLVFLLVARGSRTRPVPATETPKQSSRAAARNDQELPGRPAQKIRDAGAGRLAFEEALEFSKTYPADYSERIQEFRRVAGRFPAFREGAQSEIDKINVVVRALLGNELELAKALESEEALYTASAALRDFARKFKDFPAGKEALKTAVSLEDKMKRKFCADIEKAKALAAQGKYIQSLDVLAQVESYGNPAMCKQAAQLEEQISRKAVAAEKKTVVEEAQKAFETAAAALRDGDFKTARQHLRKLRCEPLNDSSYAKERHNDIAEMMWKIAKEIGHKKAYTENECMAELFSASKVTARKKDGKYYVTLTYDFETGQQLNDWLWQQGRADTPRWKIITEDGRKSLQAKGAGSQMLWLGSFTGDTSVKARLKLKGAGRTGILMHHQGNQYYAFMIKLDRQFFEKSGVSEKLAGMYSKGVCNLICRHDVFDSILPLKKTSSTGSAKSVPAAGKWLLMKARKTGKNLKLILDGRILASGTDDTYSNGTVALEVGDTRVLWDEVTISGLLTHEALHSRRLPLIETCIEEGSQAYRKGRYEAALGHFDKLARMVPDSAEAWCWYGASLIEHNLWEEAVLSLELSLRQNRASFRTYHWLGCAYSKCADYEKAIEAFKKSLETCPDNKEGWRNLYQCYCKLNRTGDAQAVLASMRSAEQTELLPQLSLTDIAGGSTDKTGPASSDSQKSSVTARLLKFAKRNYPGITRKAIDELERFINEARRDPYNPGEALRFWEKITAGGNIGKLINLRAMISVWKGWKIDSSFPWWK